ncbi:hypothetical protein [Parapedobacter sp. DT-150]|uniref:hypothetical protein n=1 Tax=Parapedobacter sp. DT-150 TaxID=3396162 RepID=UPI003F1A64E6
MANKAITFIKQYFFMLALAATFVGFSAFKYAERFAAPQSGWYEVEATGDVPSEYDNPENQTIGSHLESDPSGDCNPTNEEKPCAVFLEFDELTYTGPTDIENMTVEEIADEPGAEISPSSAGNSDGYSRRDQ